MGIESGESEAVDNAFVHWEEYFSRADRGREMSQGGDARSFRRDGDGIAVVDSEWPGVIGMEVQ